MTPKHRTSRSGMLCLMVAASAFVSCIRVDYEECPPLSVDIVVKDKNYANVNKVDLEDAVAEDLPFRSYVGNLTYALVNAHTGDTVLWEPLFDVPAGITTYHVDFPTSIPFGTYVFTVWGGLADDEPLCQGGDSLDLHPGGIVGGDPYLQCDTLIYDYRHNTHTVNMERIKGKLIIETEHLPAVAVSSANNVNNIRTRVAPDFQYGGAAKLTRQSDWRTPGDYKVWKTVLAPSIGDKRSVLDLDFQDASGNVLTALLPKDVNITMKRNSLTVLRYIWAWNDDEQRYAWTILMLVDDNWEVVHEMVLN